MDHYLDIRLRASDADMGGNQLMAHLFYKVHVWLAHNDQGSIGVSFPEMGKTPGCILRVHGTATDLEAFAKGEWRRTVQLWMDPLSVLAVPAGATVCNVKRIQAKSAHNMRKRAVAKGRFTAEQALTSIPDSATKPLDLPFLVIQSASSGQRVRFFIQQDEASKAVEGAFNSYGMGQSGATVPWF